MKRLFCRVVLAAETVFLELFYSFAVTYFIGKWAIASAYTARGYEAHGGEYLLIVVTPIFSYYFIHRFFKHLGGSNESNKEGSGGTSGKNDYR